LVDGKWKMADSTLCDISALGDPTISSDPACA
jgi:hypothetical protein